MAKHDIVVIADYVSDMVKGPLSVPEFKQITDEILEACLEKDVRKVLIDVTDAGGPFSDSDKLEFASYASEKLIKDVDKYAYIYPKALTSYTPQEISQAIGLNVRAFSSLDDALAWIEKG